MLRSPFDERFLNSRIPVSFEPETFMTSDLLNGNRVTTRMVVTYSDDV